MYKVFVRNWWKKNSKCPSGREPDSNARKMILGYMSSEKEARDFCKEYNETHEPGYLSRKAEYMQL